MTFPYMIRLGFEGPHFAAPPDRTLLQSAEAAGVPWASACRNGTCRSCIQQLEQGHVTYRIEWPGLLPEEKAAGWFLPCVAYPQSDGVVRVIVVDTPEDPARPGQSLPVG